MKLNVYAIYDAKTNAFAQPFYQLTEGEARRTMSTLCQDPEHLFYKHPHDFELFQLAEFDNIEGVFKPNKKSLGTAAGFRVDQHNVEVLFPGAVDKEFNDSSN